MKKEKDLTLDIKNKIPYVCIFGGGAVRGLAYIGVIEALNDLDVEIKKVAGSSVGAIFAAFLAAGYETDELIEIFKDLNFQIFKDINFSFKPQLGISKGGVFYNFVKNAIEKKIKTKDQIVTFKDIDMDLFIFASDLTNCRPRIFSKYTTPDFEVAKAVRISATFPGLMNPVEYDNSLLVDGDLIKSQPLWLVDPNLNPQDYRVLEFRLEGGKQNYKLQSPIDFANTVLSCISNYATEHLVKLYGKKDKFDYIIIDTENLLLIDLNIPIEKRKKLIQLGYDTTCEYFKYKLPQKKLALKKIYSQILDAFIVANNKLYEKRFFEAKNKILELFVILCDKQHVIDSTIFKQINAFYKFFSTSLIKHSFFNVYSLENKKAIFHEMDNLISILTNKIEEIDDFLKR